MSGNTDKKRATILVIDDDPQIRELVTKGLELQYQVYAAHDAADAAAVLKRIPTPSLIICDVMMPKQDGVNFVMELKKQPKLDRVPIIFLTAKTGPLDVLKGINAGARHYVTKPFKLPDLLAKVAKIVGS